MARCRRVRAELSAWIDGALPSRPAQRVRRHLAVCPGCAAEAEELRSAIAWQRQVLPAVLATCEPDVPLLQVRMEQAIDSERLVNGGKRRARMWIRGWRRGLLGPLAAAAAAATVLLILVSLLGGPSAVLIPLGIESPPPAVARQPELFMDYSLIQHLDALEHFDTVESTPLDADQGAHNG